MKVTIRDALGTVGAKHQRTILPSVASRTLGIIGVIPIHALAHICYASIKNPLPFLFLAFVYKVFFSCQ